MEQIYKNGYLERSNLYVEDEFSRPSLREITQLFDGKPSDPIETIWQTWGQVSMMTGVVVAPHDLA